ncbi:MAG: ATP-binding protein [Pseudomonadota bacterium]
MAKLRSILPRGLYSRAALILIVPIVTIQLVVSMAFIQRHFDRVTQQLTGGVVIELRLVLDAVNTAADLPEARARLALLAPALEMRVRIPAPPEAPQQDRRATLDLSGAVMQRTLQASLPGLRATDVMASDGLVQMRIDTGKGEALVQVSRSRMAASNPHQLLVLMIVTSVLMTVIAYVFLRNQLRPITKLADAAEAFGKGQHVKYRPRGALQVRAAGAAFLDMRARIERQIEQRTLMLSGVSHDLRTPLTRMKLGLSMLPEDEETAALIADVDEMQRLVDEFLSFARGDAMEGSEATDPLALAQVAVDQALRLGHPVRLLPGGGEGLAVMRPQAVLRALENLIGNAVRFGTRVEVSVGIDPATVRFVVEDDGPGIPRDQREEALRPFTRLDGARDPNRGGGVGLGLSIAGDIARSHGGALRLSEAGMGGLRAELVLAR